MDMSNKVIIVTGAARGIGQEYARYLGQAGAKIVVADINDCDETVELTKQAGGTAISVNLDVTDINSVNEMIEVSIQEFGQIDGLINNAALYGTLQGGRFDTLSESDWDAAMAVNVKGIWNCCKGVVPEMRKVGGGSIINITSLAASYGTPYVLHYTTSKAAVGGLTRGLARELGRYLIRVNSISPSAVLTEGTNEFFAGKLDVALKTISQMQSIPNNLSPSDLVGTAHWLLSDASKFITGQDIAVDGGTVMH
ncbi:SDR family NAD(P)-dependent oxidoreductase [Sneathiella sp. HT1-7]|uniref:SDR family NAD(P)-dependent oxidoreductase n=1 Tax=Sneathiella sp. HT1-7 TaxID=2887192 RepID=UPI001D13F386|nr:SDR family oxidoreductase [Sneathiella sp. HT1-7]MCC3306196.1 SDR family oxidoreductase [Sneathiella sp. HT1-7]